MSRCNLQTFAEVGVLVQDGFGGDNLAVPLWDTTRGRSLSRKQDEEYILLTLSPSQLHSTHSK